MPRGRKAAPRRQAIQEEDEEMPPARVEEESEDEFDERLEEDDVEMERSKLFHHQNLFIFSNLLFFSLSP